MNEIPSSNADSELRRYECRVRSRRDTNKLETLTIEANSLEEVSAKLLAEGYLIVSVEPVTKGGEKTHKSFLESFLRSGPVSESERMATAAAKQEKSKIPALQFLSRVSVRELISFAIQLSALLQGGIPLIKSLQIVQKGTQNTYFKTILENCIKNVSQGLSLSSTISGYPKVFPSVWVNLIQVGEESGKLPDVLKEISHYQEAAQRIKGKVISAFFYPAILILFATCAIGFLLLKIIPQFEGMFVGMNIQLPMITQVVIAVSKVLRHQFLIVLALIIATVTGISFWRKTKQGKFLFDLFRLKAPIMGPLVMQVSIVRFARGLATLIRAGVPILQSLEIAGRLAENVAVEETLRAAREAVRGGRSLGVELESTKLFPVFMTQLVAVGEESGELDRFLDMIANYYEERIDTFLGRLTTLLEPLLLIVVGAIIGVLVISMILPIMELSTGGVH